MNSGFIKIIDCFNITRIGLLTEIQHYENGIPPNTEIIDLNTEESWIVKKRIFSGTLLIAKNEVFFDCETSSEHFSTVFKTIEDRQIAVEKELEKRKSGIYWYLLTPSTKNQKMKPDNGSELKIISQ